MATLPQANTSIQAQAGVIAVGADLLTVIAPVATAADATPRLWSNAAALLAFHGYAPGVDYAALHIEETGLPVLFVPIAVATAGVVSQQDDSGVDGTSVITITGTPLEETDIVLTVVTGGTIGTDLIDFDLSLDGGRTTKRVRLGTASSYAIPHIGITLAFAAGDIDVDDVYTARTSAPKGAQAGYQAAREALAELTGRPSRNTLLIGDLEDSDDADDAVTEANAYETSDERFVFWRASVNDQRPAAKLSNVGTITFATAGDTITRSAGSFLADGFAIGQTVTVAGSSNNNGAVTVTDLSATVMTVSENLTDEGPVAAGTVTMTAPAETKAAWRTRIDAEYIGVASQKRISLGAGRARKLSKIHGWRFRRPVTWADTIREYQHSPHIPTWRKLDGPLSGWTLEDENGILVEHDERVDGGLLAAGFTCFRTWGNGPEGAFIAQSLTREDGGSVLVNAYAMNVANAFCTVVQGATENVIGSVYELDAAGKLTPTARKALEREVNRAVQIAMLQDNSRLQEGPLASAAVWTASADDVLNVPEPVVTGTGDLRIGAAIHTVNTTVRVQQAGA